MDNQQEISPKRDGQGLVEYVLILLLIVVICVTALTYIGVEVENRIPSIDNSTAAPTSPS